MDDSPLAGIATEEDSQQPPVTDTVAPATDALADSQQPMEIPAPFTQRVADATNNLAESAPPRPGAWARTLMGGVMDALSGFGAGGKVPPGAGGLYGAGAAIRQQQAVRQQQQQQAIENQNKQRQMGREEAIARATIAHENAATAHDEMLTASLSLANQQKSIEIGKSALEPFLTGGAPIIQEGITSDEAQRLIQEKKLSPTQQHVFPSGQIPILDKDGKPMMDKAGNPVMRNTYTVVGDVPQVTLDAANAKLISENTPYKLPEGSTMSGLVYGTLVTRAKAAQTAQMAIDEQLAEAGVKKLQTQQTADALNMRSDWNKALAKSRGDVAGALRFVQTDKQMVAKYPDAASLVNNLYGGKFEEVRHNQADERAKQQEIAEKAKEAELKAKSQLDFTGDVNAVDPATFRASLDPNARAVVDLIGQGRVPLNNPAYLLARKPEVMGAVEKAYPGFDASKVSSYQATYKDFTEGTTSKELVAGGTALGHLAELRALNTLRSRIPGTEAYQAYQNQLDTVAPELARFYGNETIPGIAALKETLGATFNRDAAIRTQAASMGVRLDNLETKWKNAAPSKAYEAPMPGLSNAAKQARASLDPEYAKKITPAAPQAAASMPTATNPATGQQVMWNGTAWVPKQAP